MYHIFPTRRLTSNVGRLYKNGPDKTNPQTQHLRVVKYQEVFDLIASQYNHLQHPGVKMTFSAIQERYWGIIQDEVDKLLGWCTICSRVAPNKMKPPAQPIVSHSALERLQVDLIDMSAIPDGPYMWISHLKDHFTKMFFSYPLEDKSSENVARCIGQWMRLFAVPNILQCENSREFKGVLLVLLKNYSVKIINGSPQHPQTQGLVEQANGIMKKELSPWRKVHTELGKL